MGEFKRCPYCGASMQEYKRNFSKDLARCAWRIYEAGGVDVDVSMLGLTNNQYANFQRLRFWGLIEKVMHDDDRGKGGFWNMTEEGFDFVRGKVKIRKYAITYRGNVERHEGDWISIGEVAEDWWYRPEVLEKSRPHIDPDQV